MSTTDNERSELFGSMKDAMPTHNVMRDDFGFEVPVETVPLPSGGKCYDEDHPLHGKETVEIRAMTAREEDILTSRALIKKGTVISHLIKSCMIDKRVDRVRLRSSKTAFKRKISQDSVTFLNFLLWNQLCSLSTTF